MTDPAWYPARNDKELILDFILWFSRIEYALKCDGQFSKITPHFQADWQEFKNELARHPFPAELSEALSYIKKSPPLKQIGFGKWELVHATDDWDYAIRAIKTVRNNLFHGGKHYTGPVLQPVRDRELLAYCLEIMQTIVRFMTTEMKETFDRG